jgi:hypothetical protein
MLNIVFRTLAITDTIEDFVAPYVQQAFEFLLGFEVWIQAAILLGIGIFTLVGVFVFIKKFIKVFLILAVIGAVLYVLYGQGVFDDILGSFGSIMIGV